MRTITATTTTSDLMDWSDVFGIAIASIAVVVTLLAIYIGYLLSRNYSTHIKEMQDIRNEFAEFRDELSRVNALNSGMLRESTLSARTLFDWIMLDERVTKYVEKKNLLERSKSWKGRTLLDSEVSEISSRIDGEIAAVRQSLNARRTELYWLVGGQNERDAHLHALISTTGDLQTISLFKGFRQTSATQVERDNLLIAIARLEQRLGRSR